MEEKHHPEKRLTFGKRQEFAAISRLLKEGCDVYMTLVDDRGIDCVIRKDNGKYLDIQIKARSKNCKPAYIAQFPNVVIEKPRENYFFIFYSEPLDEYWVIPSTTLVKKAYLRRDPNYGGSYRVSLASKKKNGEISYKKEFKKYRDAFHLLK